MSHMDLSSLIEQIRSNPSVLFLGQNYLSSYSGRDPFYEIVNRSICNGTMPTTPSYKNIWNAVNDGKPLNNHSFSKLSQAAKQVPTQPWLRSILSMGWGMVFTSSVDACLTHCVGLDFVFNTIPRDEKRFRGDYIKKNKLHGIYLYGTVDGPDYPPVDEKALRKMAGGAGKHIQWIYDDILRYTAGGVLVIDGWDPDHDWMSNLLENAGEMGYHSIFLFGATSHMEDNEYIHDWVEEGILSLCPQTFAQALSEYGYFDEEDDALWLTTGASSGNGKTITIQSKHGRDTYLNVPFSALDSLDGRVTILDDDLGNEPDRNPRSESFARFLNQRGTPNWKLCTQQAGFYFARKVDEELWDALKGQLKKKASRRGVLLLEGVSNSGKTATLVHLAMRLRDEHLCPVIYISGLPKQSDFEKPLKEFIKRYITNRQDSEGYWVDNVIVLWDGNADASAIRRYESLAKYLMECNALVVGTVYRHEMTDSSTSTRKSSVISIHVNAVLTREERQSMGELLKRVDPDMYNRFRQVTKGLDSPNLFYILQRLSMSRYSEEWKKVKKLLEDQFNLEVDRTEVDTQKAIEEFNQQIEKKVQDAIVNRGVGAAWQLQLEQYLEKLKAQGRYDPDAELMENAVQDAKTKKLLALQDDIHFLNGVLAMAGQFSIPLPLTLLLGMLSHSDNALSEENLFIDRVLFNDSLVDYDRDEAGYAYVCFRHPSEAEQYISRNFGKDPYECRKKEVELLCKIISACSWERDEAKHVISLVRCFGPNSSGKYSQNPPHGRYTDYIEYLPKIAYSLKEYAYDNLEAILVYAHFLREKYQADRGFGQFCSAEDMEEARAELRKAIENHDQENRQQYNRLIVELCANLVCSMPHSREEGTFDKVRFRALQTEFDEAIRTWVDDKGSSNFTTNSLLDIWLNAVLNFHDSFDTHEMAMADSDFKNALLDSQSYIDDLFLVQDDFSSVNLLAKMDTIYSWLNSNDMEKNARYLASQGNDAFLYMTARRCWLTEEKAGRSPESIVQHDLFFIPDNPEGFQEILPVLRPKAVAAASKAIEILEKDRSLITKSTRCLYMLIRSKWLYYTERFLLEEKQTPWLNREQWKDLYNLCSEYDRYCSLNDIPPKPALILLQAVYSWAFTSQYSESKSKFYDLRQRMNSDWLIERIGLCSCDDGHLRVFRVNIRRRRNEWYPVEGYYAEIAEELTAKDPEASDLSLERRDNIHVPPKVMAYLFDGQDPTERYNISKPVTLWFTAAGPSLGFPMTKGGERIHES